MRNSDILFIYDAKMCNPNGDPDDENRPRMDIETSRNIVTDVRLKRYIRDYWQEKGEGVFVATVDEKTVDATKRLAYWVSSWILNGGSNDPSLRNDAQKIQDQLKKNEDIKAGDIVKLISSEDDILKSFLDVRMFGATMPIKDEKKGSSYTFTGPVQFNWGYSLNKVEQVYSNTITSTFAGRTRGEGEEYGAMGKDYRLYYSLLAFHGVISAHRAKHTKMQDDDVIKLEEALIKAIPLQATRSKIGQYPRLMLRVEYNDDEIFLGDLRRYVRINKDEGLRDISEVTLDISALDEKLTANADKINLIKAWQDNDLKLSCKGKIGALKDIVYEGIKGKIQMI
ncbi:TPA: type I-B CRISPR-associated protein Cas7/Csh2 [Candidatus Poribacteria bacterium]|nr:type I-B CRISPR-associated protein Cas7/Csh2 [Candidatus Poribacteria bacterium]